VIAELLAPPVVVVEVFEDLDAALLPEEAGVVAGALPARRREFATVRACARAALARLGVAAGPILPGEGGAPIWPPGVVGSMSHCAGYRGCGVAPSRQLRGLGIDAEPDEPLPDDVLDVVASASERAQLHRLWDQNAAVHWDRLLFSAKEAVYKAWFPLAGRWLEFDEVTVRLTTTGRFTARVLVPGPVRVFTGRWTAVEGLLGTAVPVPYDRECRS
jgi:4'-phosphopantetheinyl transferase EntD